MIRFVLCISILLFASDADACHRCNRSPCSYVQPQAVVQKVADTNVYVHQVNYPAPLVGQGTSAYVANGGYQSQVLPFFDPNRYVSSKMELLRAYQQTGAMDNAATGALVERLVSLQAPAVERLAAGQAGQMVLRAAGLDPQYNSQTTSQAIVVRQEGGVVKVEPLTQAQAQLLTLGVTTTTSSSSTTITQGIGTTPPPQPGLSTEKSRLAITTQFCGKCHGTDVASPGGGLYLGDDPNVATEMKKRFFDIVEDVTTGKMPKGNAPKPTAEEKSAILDELQAIIRDHGSGS